MNVTEASGIGRDIDPSHRSNLFVLIASPIAGVAWGVWKLVTEGDWWHAVGRGFVAGGAVFLAWAIARELDPDRPWTAGVAAIVAGSVIGAGVPSLLVAASALLAARVTARTTGRAPYRGDLIFLLAMATASGAADMALPAALVLAGAVVADRLLPGGARPVSVPFGIAAGGAALGAAALWGSLDPSPGLPSGPEWVAAAAAIGGLLALGRPREVAAVGDRTGVPLAATRVRSARLVAFAVAGLTFAWMGGPGLTSGSAVWAALASVAIPFGPRTQPGPADEAGPVAAASG